MGVAARHLIPVKNRFLQEQAEKPDLILHGGYLFRSLGTPRLELSMTTRLLELQELEYDLQVRTYNQPYHWLAVSFRSYRALAVHLGLKISRGPGHSYPWTSEDVISSLIEPLEPGRYYRLTVDMLSRDDLGQFSWDSGFTAFTYPVSLQIRGRESESGPEEMLASSEPVTNLSWKNYSFILYPTFPVHHLIFRIIPEEESGGPGNLLLDHVIIEEIDEPPVEFGELTIPNVFTTNGYGINDQLLIRGLAPESSIVIFDRTGIEVYRSERYSHDWNGTGPGGRPLPQDTYWYVLFPSDSEKIHKGIFYIKRE